MRRQVGIGDGTTFPLVTVAPAHIIVPSALETVTEQVLSDIFVPTTSATTTTRTMRSLNLVVEPRLDATSVLVWYMAANPGMIDTIELMGLAGEEAMQTQTLNGWDIDGLEVRARLDRVAGVIDHRGFARNAGA